MQTLPLADLIPDTVEAYGALDFDVRPNGIAPRRLPAWTRPQLPQPVDVMARMPSGVRLRFNTDATRVGVTFLATNQVTPPKPRRPINFDLETSGQLFGASSTAGNTILLDANDPTAFELQRGEPDTLWFEGLPTGDKLCELWLPQNAFVELRALELEDGATLSPAEPESRTKWIHHGSSISHCMEADQPALIWPAVAAREAGVALQNLGLAGQCHLDQFVARTIRDSDADIISIKTGINVINADSMRERVFAPALHGFLDTIREGKPNTPIALISPIYCPSAETNPGPTVPGPDGKFVTIPGHTEIRDGCMTLSRTREIIEDVVTRRSEAGDANLRYLSGLELFGEADAGDLPDDLHPNPAGYIRMGQRFASAMLGDLVRG